MRKKRLHFGLVFQSFNLFPQYTALQNVTLARELLAREAPDVTLDAEQRRQKLEAAYPITVGDDVWFGGHVVVLPGVTIGSGTVVGAGSVVTRDLPGGVLALGNPCRVLRPITAADRERYRTPEYPHRCPAGTR